LQIKHVVPGSVAHRAALEPGTTIVRINGQWVIGMPDSQV
jgi:S1-C subfamily serine protease